MKLKDKFHSPKIKRTPSKKGKQLQPEPTAKSTEKPANKVCVCVCVYTVYIYQNIFVCIVGSTPFFCLPHSAWATVWERIVFLFHVLCSPSSIVSVCTRLFLLVPTASQSLLQLALLQQVSKLMSTWIELPEWLPPHPLKDFGVMNIVPSNCQTRLLFASRWQQAT